MRSYRHCRHDRSANRHYPHPLGHAWLARARCSERYVFSDGDSEIEASEGIHVMKLPEHYAQLSPILHIVPLQPLSYHAALAKETDVYELRSLAKPVTVE